LRNGAGSVVSATDA